MEPFIQTFLGVTSLTKGCTIIALIDMMLVFVGVIVMMVTEILSPDENLTIWCAVGVMVGVYSLHNSLVLIIAILRKTPIAIAVWAISKVLCTAYDIYKWLYVDIKYPKYFWLHIDALHPANICIFTCVKMCIFVYELLIVWNYLLEKRSKELNLNPQIGHATTSTQGHNSLENQSSSNTAGPSFSTLTSWLPFGK